MFVQVGLFLLSMFLFVGAIFFFKWKDSPREFTTNIKTALIGTAALAGLCLCYYVGAKALGYVSVEQTGYEPRARVAAVIPTEPGAPGRLVTNAGSFAIEHYPRHWLQGFGRYAPTSLLSHEDAYTQFVIGKCYALTLGDAIASPVDAQLIIYAHETSCAEPKPLF